MNKYFVVVSDHQGDMHVEQFDDIESAEGAVRAASDECNYRAVVIRCENICYAQPTQFKIEYPT